MFVIQSSASVILKRICFVICSRVEVHISSSASTSERMLFVALEGEGCTAVPSSRRRLHTSARATSCALTVSLSLTTSSLPGRVHHRAYRKGSTRPSELTSADPGRVVWKHRQCTHSKLWVEVCAGVATRVAPQSTHPLDCIERGYSLTLHSHHQCWWISL